MCMCCDYDDLSNLKAGYNMKITWGPPQEAVIVFLDGINGLQILSMGVTEHYTVIGSPFSHSELHLPMATKVDVRLLT